MKFSLSNNKVVNYIKESKDELKKVVWPTKQELVRHTLIVIVISLVMAVFLGIFDFIFAEIVEKVIK